MLRPRRRTTGLRTSVKSRTAVRDGVDCSLICIRHVCLAYALDCGSEILAGLCSGSQAKRLD